jgi:predicted RNase H-like HicB family nuclease
MTGQPERQPRRRTFTVDVELVEPGAWHVAVRELPDTWTVAFDPRDIERRARQRIALDTGLEPDEFDVAFGDERRGRGRPFTT